MVCIIESWVVIDTFIVDISQLAKLGGKIVYLDGALHMPEQCPNEGSGSWRRDTNLLIIISHQHDNHHYEVFKKVSYKNYKFYPSVVAAKK